MRTFIPCSIDSSTLSIASDVAKPGANQLPKQMCLITEPDKLRKLIDNARVSIDQKQPLNGLTRAFAGPK